MPQTALSNLGVNFDWEEGDDGWKHGMDANLMLLDAMGQAVIVSQVNADPWASISNPAAGKMYLVGTSPTGATAPWDTASAATIANKLAIATGDNIGVSRWLMVTPKDGWSVFNQETGQEMTFTGVHGSGGYWALGSGIGNASGSTVINMTTSAEPGSPAVGDAYIIYPVGSGANWSTTHDNYYARWNGTTWLYRAPVVGMRVKNALTGEWFTYTGSVWEEELKYLSANSRGIITVDCGNSGAGPYSADRAAPTYTFTRADAAKQTIKITNASMLGSIDFTRTPTPGTPTGTGNISDFYVSGENAPEETWTLTCTNHASPGAEIFSVVGSVSGTMASATVGVAYDNGVIAFTLNAGGTNFSSNNAGEADRIVFTTEEMLLLIAADEQDVVAAMIGVIHDSQDSVSTFNRCKLSGGDGSLYTVTLRQTDVFDLVQVLPIFNAAISLLSATYSHKASAPLRSRSTPVKTANYTLVPADAGSSIVMDTTSGNLTITIPDSPAVDMGEDAVIRIFHKDVNTLTVAGAGGVTLVGTTAGTTNKFLTLQRAGSTDTWYCG